MIGQNACMRDLMNHADEDSDGAILVVRRP